MYTREMKDKEMKSKVVDAWWRISPSRYNLDCSLWWKYLLQYSLAIHKSVVLLLQQ